MVKIIAVHNQKGGVGKTTTTTNVGFELARKGYKVLLADLDPQATLTSALGVTDPEETVFSALQGAVDGKETRLPWIRLQENISLCPSCRKMADAEYLLQNEYGRENFLNPSLMVNLCFSLLLSILQFSFAPLCTTNFFLF
jgi:chromosome partitioning protein